MPDATAVMARPTGLTASPRELPIALLVFAALGIALTFPVAERFGKAMGTLFPVFSVSIGTVYLQIAAALVIGCVAAVFPCVRASRLRITDGLRHAG